MVTKSPTCVLRLCRRALRAERDPRGNYRLRMDVSSTKVEQLNIGERYLTVGERWMGSYRQNSRGESVCIPAKRNATYTNGTGIHSRVSLSWRTHPRARPAASTELIKLPSCTNDAMRATAAVG